MMGLMTMRQSGMHSGLDTLAFIPSKRLAMAFMIKGFTAR